MPPMCWKNLPASKHNANPLNILVHLHLLCAQGGKELEVELGGESCANPQNSSIQSFALFTPFDGRNLNDKLWPRNSNLGD